MREIRRDPEYLDDPLLLEYVQGICRRWSKSRREGHITPDIDSRFAWEAFLVRDRSVNAFALPGGYVGVHLGLIAITACATNSASVLAHGGATSRSAIARGIANSKRQSILGLAALVDRHHRGEPATARARPTPPSPAARPA